MGMHNRSPAYFPFGSLPLFAGRNKAEVLFVGRDSVFILFAGRTVYLFYLREVT